MKGHEGKGGIYDLRFAIYDLRLAIGEKEIEPRPAESGGRLERGGVERDDLAHRIVLLLNKNTEKKEERILSIDENDRRPFFIFIHGILSIVNTLVS